MFSENPSGADNQQETTRWVGSSETARQARSFGAVKIQSDPHGDMGSESEMSSPTLPHGGVSNNCA